MTTPHLPPPLVALALLCLLARPVPAADVPASSPAATSQPTTRPAVTFSTNFEGGSLGKIEVLGPDTFRWWVQGQYNERGRNRQTSWFYVRLQNVAGRPLTVTLTDLVGEYNDRPGAVPHGPDIVYVHSPDGRTWTHFAPEQFSWDDEKKEATLRFTPVADAIYVAHQPPYTPSDLATLLADVGRSPHARVEVIGQTVGGRDMPMVTVTDLATPDEGKRCVWLQARQHAWESGTSWVMEGALRFVTSDDPAAAELRRTTVLRFTPLVDLDGAAAGKVRFNANGYDVNRNWLAVDLRDPAVLRLMPEIWYTKKAITSAHAVGPRIDLLVNLHNTETGEFLQTAVGDDAPEFAKFQKLYDRLVERTLFDPSRGLDKPRPNAVVPPPADTTNSLWRTHKVPAALMELRVGTSKKLGRRPVVEDRLRFGRELITEMAEAAR